MNEQQREACIDTLKQLSDNLGAVDEYTSDQLNKIIVYGTSAVRKAKYLRSLKNKQYKPSRFRVGMGGP